MLRSADGQQAPLVVFLDMPRLPADQVYELWLIAADGREHRAALL